MRKLAIPKISKQIAAPLEAIASPQRIAIMLVIGQGEACVCHLEAALGWRQSYISQHLMALRKAHILKDRRVGRYVYYSLGDAIYLDLITFAAEISGFTKESIFELVNTRNFPLCECPYCAPTLIPGASL